MLVGALTFQPLYELLVLEGIGRGHGSSLVWYVEDSVAHSPLLGVCQVGHELVHLRREFIPDTWADVREQQSFLFFKVGVLAYQSQLATTILQFRMLAMAWNTCNIYGKRILSGHKEFSKKAGAKRSCIDLRMVST